MGSKKGAGKAKVAKLPKKKCCVSSTKCKRCPLRMLKEGTLPPGYTVKKRRLVKVDVKVDVKMDVKMDVKPARKRGDRAA
ncbi:hypothetical protein [Nocardioides xinjiangensis]|uniref:hypothetical protein n=1 Tax=Nocardioides xinjiangensis TaxID=2817376 RepID=UPI001B31042D|nr:hypothetical protein [Nocardioides sp. SYSU D00514]